MRLFLIISLSILFNSCASLTKEFSNLDLGSSNLHQTITTKKLDKGITYIDINRGYVSEKDFYTLSSNVLNHSKEVELTKRLKELNYLPQKKLVNQSTSQINKELAIISVGKYSTKEEAILVQKKIEKDSIFLKLSHSSEDSKQKFGPFHISILKIDLNKFSGSVKSVLANNYIETSERTSLIAKRQKNIIAAINGGFFVMFDKDGTVGDLAGISVIDGELVSEAINGRAALVIDNSTENKFYIAHNVKTNLSLSIKNKKFKIGGINRKPGAILNCGNLVNNSQIPPIHDYKCSNPNEIILFKHSYGKKSKITKGINFTVNKKSNTITSINLFNGGFIEKDEYLIQATGTYVKQLLSIIKKGENVVFTEEVSSAKGKLQLKKGMYIINGGPTLLRNGLADISNLSREGWQLEESSLLGDEVLGNRINFYNSWVVKRNPRTAVGLDGNGNVYFLVIYGRNPKKSVGVSIQELEKIMEKLNIKEALNLDGGGSSVMIVNNQKTGCPSDISGERKVGDAIVILSE